MDGPHRVTVAPATEVQPLLALIAAYQRFYQTEGSDDRNRIFFSRFLSPHPVAMLLEARVGEHQVGFACLYWSQSSVSARDVVTLNDLFVEPSMRGQGVGRALIDAALDVARGRGARALQWITAPSNEAARRLYDSYPVSTAAWLEYTLEI